MKFEKEAREVLLAGAKKVFMAVSSTLGARGRNVVYQRFGRPKITNDGVTIARSIDLEDAFERQGAELLKEAAEKANDEGGDGTTTAIVLAYTMYAEGLKLIENGANPMELRTWIEKEAVKILAELKTQAIEVTTEAELDNIATISVESPETGKIVADAVRAAGKDGLVIVEEDSVPGIRKEEVTGYKFDKGWENPYFITNPDKMEAVLDDPLILVADKKWNLIGDLAELLEEVKKAGKDKMLIIAEEISGELMKFLVLNRIKLRFHAVVVRPPFNKSMLEDIAALTGAEAILDDKGMVKIKMAQLGTARRVVVTEHSTTIIDGGGNAEGKIESLRKNVEEAEEGYDKEKLQERLSKLTGKTVVLHVGAATEAEARYLKDKIDDAVNATRAASEEGVVAGGGMTLARIAAKFYNDEGDGFQRMMYRVLTAPVDKILLNSGVENPAKLIAEMISQNETSGYDALEGKVVENLVDKGIIDPVKVTRAAFKAAASLAPMLLTTETVIAEIEDKK